ncbi:MAG: glycosyltransferase family 2 protein [Endomicrobia bacterium]|nr:glycosyltransferase family 2 protein [Endomicrobiia bacterium]
MDSIDISVILVNYNTKNLTVNAINSVFEQTKNISFEIIVVDNNSTDGSVEEFQKLFRDKITILKSENLGYGHGNNMGIKQASGKYVFLLNTDALLLNNVMKILFDYIETNPKCGACSPNIYDINGKFTHSKGIFLKNNFSALYNLVFHHIYHKLKFLHHVFSKKPSKAQWSSFCAILMRKDAVENAGYFDEDFFLYCEDEELSFRMVSNGYDFYVVPEAKVRHLEGGSFDCGIQKKEKRLRLMTYSKFILFEKEYGKNAPQKHYEERLRFFSLINFLSLGFLSNRCKNRKRILIEEYERYKKLKPS